MANEDENTALFLHRVACAVIIRALNDLYSKRGSYRYNTARNFCFGLGVWKESLQIWCELAEVEPEKVKNLARKKIYGFTKN